MGLKHYLLVNSAKHTDTCVPPGIFGFLHVIVPINTNVSIDNINHWVFVTKKQYVFCEVGSANFLLLRFNSNVECFTG